MAANRKQRRIEKSISSQEASKRPEKLTEIPREEWGRFTQSGLSQVWVSRKYLVQLFNEQTSNGIARLSICRTTLNSQGRWNDGLSWDELQAIKREVGYGNYYAVEVYPRDCDIVNVVNMRHLWICEFPLRIGWVNS